MSPEADTSNRPPQINAFSVRPESIEQGQSAVLSWDVSNTDSVVITPDVSNIAVSGSEQVNPALTTSYIITATNDFGTSTLTLTLPVTERTSSSLSQSPVIISFEAQPENIYAGAAVELSWEVINATSISLEWGNNDPLTINEASGSLVFRPVIPTVYILTASNISKSFISEAKVTIKGDMKGHPIYDSEDAGSDWGGGGGGG
ncbi:hypothetical protein ACFLXL_02385 [Chloroflexota bacterium]